MTSFRRAALRGSDELFRPTQPGTKTAPEIPVQPPAATAAPSTRPEGRLVRLTEEEISLMVDALQKLKFPSSQKPAVTKPSVDEFERLEELRQKLLAAR